MSVKSAISSKARALKDAVVKMLRLEPIQDTDELLRVCSGVGRDQIIRDALKTEKAAEVQQLNDAYDPSIQRQEATIEHEIKRIHEWAVKHRGTHFAKRQSYVIQGHELAFHRGTGAVKPTGELKEKDIVELIVNLPQLGDLAPGKEELLSDAEHHQFQMNELLREELLRPKLELDKDAVLRLWRQSEKQPALRAALESAHLRVVVEESFTVTPAREANAEIEETVRDGKEAA